LLARLAKWPARSLSAVLVLVPAVYADRRDFAISFAKQILEVRQRFCPALFVSEKSRRGEEIRHAGV